jgi:transposase InsO family protein
MYEDSEGPHLDNLIDEYFYESCHRNELHFMTFLDNHLTRCANNDENLNSDVHVSQQKNDKYEPAASPVPKSFLIARTINATPSARILTILFDSGGTGCWINERALPRNCPTTPLDQPKSSLTLAGTLSSQFVVQLQGIILPEFDRNKTIERQGAYVFSGPCNYDIILGRDFLETIGLILDFDRGVMEWMDKAVAMEGATQQRKVELQDKSDQTESMVTQILEAKYEKWNPEDVAVAQRHLTPSQRTDIENLVRKHPKLFSGRLGRYPHQKIRLEVDPTAIPVHARAYSVAHAHRDVFKTELQRLVEIGVLRPCGATTWASPTFIIPKKDGRVRVVSDFRELNKALKRRVYPLPRIQDILNRRSGYQFFTKLDISMMFYAFELDDDSKELCTIVTPFGKFQYQRLPMGVKVAPDIAQEAIENTLRDCDCEEFIDDVGVFNTTWSEHITLLDDILSRLESAGFTINPLKCEWGVKETDFLGYWLTPVGLKPWQKKVDAILAMGPPVNVKQCRSFIGAVNFYRDLWPRRSHVLHPLTSLTGKGKFLWTERHQRAFKEMKALVAADTLMHYPDHNLPFDVYTDASDYQLGACIMQQGRPVAYYSRKLNDAQKNYTTMEKELLAIVSVFREFRSILLGAKLTVYTDHKNLTFRNLNSSRVLRWRLFLDEYDAHFVYLAGKNNVLADAFSRLPRMDSPSEGKRSAETPETNSAVDSFFSFVDQPLLLDCFLNLPAPDVMRNPIDVRWMQENQFDDVSLNNQRQQSPLTYPVQDVMGVPLIHFRHDPLDDDATHWKIAIPTGLLDDLIHWFHSVLGHAGESRVYDSIRSRYQHPHLKRRIQQLLSACDVCRLHKQSGTGFGKLAERDVAAAPWQENHIDLIGPWKVKINGIDVEFLALTVIDPVTNIVELVRINNKTSEQVAQQYANVWLARYPWPESCVHDNGGEFIGLPFQRLLEQCAIRSRVTTSRNPQANAICERMHQTVGNILRTLLHGEPVTAQTAADIVDNALATTMHALRTSVSRSLDYQSPGEIAFGRHMLLNIPILADLQALYSKRTALVQKNLEVANRRRIRYDYQPGQRVAIKDVRDKLGRRSEGPFLISQVHTNGTVTIQRRPGVVERINIRRLIPLRT